MPKRTQPQPQQRRTKSSPPATGRTSQASTIQSHPSTPDLLDIILFEETSIKRDANIEEVAEDTRQKHSRLPRMILLVTVTHMAMSPALSCSKGWGRWVKIFSH